MATAGQLLRKERIQRNRNLSQIATETCISSRYLEAIEEDNLDVLPGDFFYRSFIKQYAQALNLSDRETGEIIAAALPFEEIDPIPALTEAMEKTESEGRSSGLRRTPTGVALALLATVLVGCSGLYAIWHSAQVEKEISPEPDTAQSPQAAASQTPRAEGVPPSVPTPEPAWPAAPAATPSQQDPGKIQVDLAATETTWVSLQSEGKTVFSGVLDPAQTKNFAVAERAKLMTGNAAGLDVRWNGKPIGPIGPRGQVRVVLLASDHYEILPPRRM
jgi:cytoskeleton protein RodZ